MFLGAARVWVEAGVPNCLKPWGVAEKAEGVGGEEEAGEAH